MVPASFGMTTKAIFPKASLSQASRESGSERQACGGARHQWGFMFHRELPADHGPSQVHRKREESHPMQTQLPRVPREHWRPRLSQLSSLRSVPREDTHCEMSPLGRCLVRHLHLSLPSLSKIHGSWIY